MLLTMWVGNQHRAHCASLSIRRRRNAIAFSAPHTRSFYWSMFGARDPPKRWTLSYDGFSSCFPVPILKLHSSCKFVCTQSRDQMTVMLFKHRNRRPHLTSEQMQISTPVHDLKCRVHVTQTTQGSILLCSYVFRPTVRCLKRCQPQADL
jgi:hypothetical protein